MLDVFRDGLTYVHGFFVALKEKKAVNAELKEVMGRAEQQHDSGGN